VANHYARFGLVLGISLVLMFMLSLSMIREAGHFQLSLGNFYISLLMVSTMGVVMLLVMWKMFDNRRLNMVLLAAFAMVFIGAFVLGRNGAFIGDGAFLRSMIPHHSRAILLCQEATLSDPEIVRLCDEIVEAQREEIAKMEDLLSRH
jgi:uncharacterized membrane protein